MLYFDTETYNEEKDISVGTYEYARTCEVLIATYAFGDGPTQIWDATKNPEPPADLIAALEDENMKITAHHATFDRNVVRFAMGIETARERWRCTMVKGYLHGFSGSLAALGNILELDDDQKKQAIGKKLINRFCKPAPSSHKAHRYDRHTHPEEWEQFCDYAIDDIGAMREIDKRLPAWNAKHEDWADYHLDQKINDTGFAVDTELVTAGAAAAEVEKAFLARRFVGLTGGAVEKPTQRDKFRRYLNTTFGLTLENTQKANMQRVLGRGDIEPDCRELIEIGLAANKTSTSKYKALAPAVSPDGRFRGGLQFAGAARTRRWSGRLFQPQNLASKGLPDQEHIDHYIEALKLGSHDLLFDDLMLFGSAALRGVIVAPEGKKLCVSDLSNIEGRANAWLAGETWKLKAFAAYDRGEGDDLYVLAVAGMLGKDPKDISKDERDGIGKVSELSLGYQGGVGALQNFARGKMEALMPILENSVPQPVIDQAYVNWNIWGEDKALISGTPYGEWIASEIVKLAWRKRHPAISALWSSCQDAAIKAITNPGKVYRAGRHLRFTVRDFAGHNYLLMKMPSGKFLVYFKPQYDGDNVTYMGVHSMSKKWVRLKTYGGKLVENACQSLSRDILVHGMREADRRGYETVLTVHDELVTETPDTGDYNVETLSEILATNPPWADGFPLEAAGFEAYRYRK